MNGFESNKVNWFKFCFWFVVWAAVFVLIGTAASFVIGVLLIGSERTVSTFFGLLGNTGTVILFLCIAAASPLFVKWWDRVSAKLYDHPSNPDDYFYN
jgi:ABC-type multidrug transport system permease subunit